MSDALTDNPALTPAPGAPLREDRTAPSGGAAVEHAPAGVSLGQLPSRPTLRLSPEAQAAGNTCVQCGLCLPACPTYLETGNEADSPRGRIRQMLGLHDGDIPYTAAGQSHLDRCLDCRACETACPSGVAYHKLIEDAREKLHVRQPRHARLRRWFFLNVLTRPNRLRLSLLPARITQRLGLWPLARRASTSKAVPGWVGKMTAMLPEKGPLWPAGLPAHSRAGGIDLVLSSVNPEAGGAGQRRTKIIAFFEGCAQQVLGSDVNRKAAELLCAAGADVISPPAQTCCGAIHHHNGAREHALEMARRNIDTYLPAGGPEPDAIVTCVAGDGAMLRQYAELFADDPRYAAKARRFASKVRDVSEALVELGLPQPKFRVETTVTYHDACHLVHGQRVASAPRQILAHVPGLTIVDLPESEVCCGAAGTYNLEQPEMAGGLAERKLRCVGETGATTVAAGNIGCTQHLRAAAQATGRELDFVHPVELLHEAVFGID